MVLSGQVLIEPFVEQRPLDTVNATFADLHEHRVSRRVILIPES
jgi:6-hydroxycyclohex-1-ene-1-carbonyl-CoA dehydrogenase